MNRARFIRRMTEDAMSQSEANQTKRLGGEFDSVLQVLTTHFGFEEFLPGQQQVIERLLEGKSAAAVFPTGGGKSLCYQLPALLLEGVTLVVSPLIALMKDQLDGLKRRGIAAARLDSTLSLDEYRAVMQDLRGGRLKLLYVAPERFQNERFRESIERARVALFAVDEAHCISEWGHHFRPDYLKLVECSRRCGAQRVLALTATATPQVLNDICRAFKIDPDDAVCNSSYRPNLTILATPALDGERPGMLAERLSQRPPGPTIVYVTLQRTAESVAARLAQVGLEARAYHAGMDDEDRTAVQDWFMNSDAGIVVATIAFGMGIDKSNIRHVYHYNLPKSLENFSQEIGRAGRDGLPATCEMFVCEDDLNVLENFAYGDTPSLMAVERFLERVFMGNRQFDLSHHELAAECDIRILVLRTLLTYLELDGFISGGTPFYSQYRFRPLQTSAEILSQFDGERRVFLEKLFRQVDKARTWFHIDVDRAAEELVEPRDRIVRALDYLNERGGIALEASGARHRFERLKVPDDTKALAQQLHARTIAREEQEIARLHQVLELAWHPHCQINFLCDHFGEVRREACGHCTRCLVAEPPRRPNRPELASLNTNAIQEVMAMRSRHPLLDDPIACARFLCGITSPALTRAKLTSHSLFGACDQQRFPEIRTLFQSRH